MPGDDGQLARRSDRGDLHAASGSDPQEEGTQRPRRVGGRPGRFDQHPSSMSTPDFRDVPVVCRRKARLAHAGIEPEVAHELLGRSEAPDITHRGDQADGHRDIDAGNRQQPTDPCIVQCSLRQGSIDHGQVFAMSIDFTQPLCDGTKLVRR